MAQLWLHTSEGWAVLPLARPAYSIAPGGPSPISIARRGAAQGILLVRVARDGDEAWALVSADERARVNGLPLVAGIRVLADHDEIRVEGGETIFFSSERLARVEPYPAESRGCCALCDTPIEPGAPAVRCPGCRLWHHQSDELGCWLHADRCAKCSHATAFDTGFRWIPEDAA